jgi:predicted PurR-regulated permease PerM
MLVTIPVSVLLAFILAPIADLFMRLRLPRWLAAAISVGLLIAAVCTAGFYGFNQASNLLSELPKYSGEIH